MFKCLPPREKKIALGFIAAWGVSCIYGCSVAAFRPTANIQAVRFPVIAVAKDPYFSTLWVDEVKRRFPDGAIVVFGHGGTIDGEWVIRQERVILLDGRPFTVNSPLRIKTLVSDLRKSYPAEVPIVLIVCNPQGLRLNDKGVYYALKNVWTSPDFSIPSRADYSPLGDCVGSVNEFVTGATMPAPASQPSNRN